VQLICADMILYNQTEQEVDNQMMFNNPFKLPTYSEWKESVEKINADVMKFYKDWYADIKKTLDK
jgi:predicted Zn-dependent peptidase